MALFVSVKVRKQHGPTVLIDCPLCLASSVPASSSEQVDDLMVLHVIPVFRLRNTFVTCSACNQELISKIARAELADYSASQLSHSLAVRGSFVGSFLSLACLILCWVPAVGLVLGIIAVWLNRRAVGWPRTASRIGLSVAGVITVVLTVWGVIDVLLWQARK